MTANRSLLRSLVISDISTARLYECILFEITCVFFSPKKHPLWAGSRFPLSVGIRIRPSYLCASYYVTKRVSWWQRIYSVGLRWPPVSSCVLLCPLVSSCVLLCPLVSSCVLLYPGWRFKLLLTFSNLWVFPSWGFADHPLSFAPILIKDA